MEFASYILYSIRADKIYVGFTSHLINRFHSHNNFSRKGFTKRYRPWIVIHVDFFGSKEEAMKREKFLKSGQGRHWIRKIVLPEMKSKGFISA